MGLVVSGIRKKNEELRKRKRYHASMTVILMSEPGVGIGYGN